MNRPRKKYPITQDGYPIESEELVTYLNEIDKYCDALEKALDKTCNILHKLDYVILARKEYGWTFKQWKEWCMKDE